MNMGMVTRIITGVVGAAIMLTLFTLPFPVPVITIAAIWLLAICELGRAVKAKPVGIILVIALNGAALWALGVVATRYLYNGPVIHQTVDALGFSVIALITCILQLILGTAIIRALLSGRTRVLNYCWHSLVLVSVPLCLAASWSHASPIALILLLGLASANDTGAVAAGKLFGKRQIVPRISPGKTLEGVIGGFAAMCALLFAVHYAFLRFDTAGYFSDVTQPAYWPFITVACAVFAVLGFFGDITFSAIKRSVGIKDFGSILPGHGGILDRIDSLLFIAPWYFLAIHLTLFINVS